MDMPLTKYLLVIIIERKAKKERVSFLRILQRKCPWLEGIGDGKRENRSGAVSPKSAVRENVWFALKTLSESARGTLIRVEPRVKTRL